MQVTDLIREDHRRLQQLFSELETSPARGDARARLVARIAIGLEVHTRAEERVFYPATRAVSRRIADAEAGHEHVRDLLAVVQRAHPRSADFFRKVRDLKLVVLDHLAHEECRVLPDAERLGPDVLDRLGREFEEERESLARAIISPAEQAA